MERESLYVCLYQGFSKFNNLTKDISDMAAYTSRIGQMFEVMDQLEVDRRTSAGTLTRLGVRRS